MRALYQADRSLQKYKGEKVNTGPRGAEGHRERGNNGATTSRRQPYVCRSCRRCPCRTLPKYTFHA
jgi:hypothetical protein